MKMQQQQKIPVIQFAYLLHSAQTPCVAELETLYKNDYTYVRVCQMCQKFKNL